MDSGTFIIFFSPQKDTKGSSFHRLAVRRRRHRPQGTDKRCVLWLDTLAPFMFWRQAVTIYMDGSVNMEPATDLVHVFGIGIATDSFDGIRTQTNSSVTKRVTQHRRLKRPMALQYAITNKVD